MKRLRTSLLPMLLAFLACGAFFPAAAEDIDVSPSTPFTFYSTASVHQTYTSDGNTIFEWDTRCQDDNKTTYFGYNFNDGVDKDKISTVQVYATITSPEGTVSENQTIVASTNLLSHWGSFTYSYTEKGDYINNTYMVVTYNNGEESKTYHFGPYTFAPNGSADTPDPQPSTTVYYVLPLQTMTAADANFIPTSDFINWGLANESQSTGTVGNAENANIYTITATGDGKVMGGWETTGYNISPILTGDYDLLFEYKTTSSTATPNVKLVVTGDESKGEEASFSVDADTKTQWRTVRMNLKEKFPNFVKSGSTTANAYVFAFVAPNSKTDDKFDFANVRYVPKGTGEMIVPQTKPTGKLTYTIDKNVCNFNVDITPGSYTLQTINVWAEANGTRYYQQTSSANPFSGSFTVPETAFGDNQTLSYNVKAEAIFNDGYTIAGNDQTNMEGTDKEQTFTKPATSGPVIVNTIDSETYREWPYQNSTDGISYTAATITDGKVVWTYPEWTDGEAVNGISGRWIKVGENNYAPKITYTISNDQYGYLYFKLKLDDKVEQPDGLNLFMFVNNNKGEIDGMDNLKMKLEEDGCYHWKSIHAYPNNSTVSYQLSMTSAGSLTETRVFGYDVKNATEAPMKLNSEEELMEIARKHYNDDKFSAKIWEVPAYDAFKAPQDEYENLDDIPSGTWSFTRCPNDFANLNMQSFHFCPQFFYILSNDIEATTNTDGTSDSDNSKKSKLYVVYQLGESFGYEKDKEGNEVKKYLKTIIPNNYVPQLRILRKKTSTASLRAVTEDEQQAQYEEIEYSNMKQVRGYLNTYEGETNEAYALGDEYVIGIKHTFTSIMSGAGYSRTMPRPYTLSANQGVITGIEEVASEAEAVPAVATVYNLQGMAVRVNVATENALEGLPAGIYIVNGKKYAVR